MRNDRADSLGIVAINSNGWYMNTEIGRNLVERYNVLPKIADKMGLDQKVNTSLWQDKAMLELNVAILHSYQKAGVTMVDHHTASKQFLMHDKREKGNHATKMSLKARVGAHTPCLPLHVQQRRDENARRCGRGSCRR
jgi:nitric oxide synthase oxygenase domain/subunit